MTIIKKTYNIKTLDEFTAKEQAEIIERHRYINIEDGFSLADYDESYALSIKEKGFLKPEIYYDLSASQGSGACFDSDELDLNILLKNFKCKHKKWIIALLNDENSVSIQIKQNQYANHYSHSRTRTVFLLFFRKFSNLKYLYALLEEVRNHVEKVYLETCDNLYNELVKNSDYLISDEAVRDTLFVNNYCFNEYSYMIERE